MGIRDYKVKGISMWISLVFMLFGTLVSWTLALLVVLGGIYVIDRFDLCSTCYICVMIYIAFAAICSVSAWSQWYVKIKTGQVGPEKK
jgi:hypothetical protein